MKKLCRMKKLLEMKVGWIVSDKEVAKRANAGFAAKPKRGAP